MKASTVWTILWIISLFLNALAVLVNVDLLLYNPNPDLLWIRLLFVVVNGTVVFSILKSFFKGELNE